MVEPLYRPDKDELCRVISAWAAEKSGIEHSHVQHLDRLNERDLLLLFLAVGFPLDERVVENLRLRYRWEWEAAQRMRKPLKLVNDPTPVGHDGEE